MVDNGENSVVTGLLYGLSLLLIMSNMVQYHHILQISSTKEGLINWDCVKYNFYELKCIRSDCQKDPQCKIIPWSTLQCIRNLNIQRRICRGRRGRGAKEAPKHKKVNNLITVETSQLDPLHSTSNEFNDLGLNLKISTGNLQLIEGKQGSAIR